MGAAWRRVRDRFRAAGLGTPEIDARRLAEAAFGVDALQLIACERQPADPPTLAVLEEYAERRLSGEPIARILGHKEFYGLSFQLNWATLIPRPETEQLVDLALKTLPGKPYARILDLGTGTGAIPVSILCNDPKVTAVAVDLSAEALVAARTNAALHGVDDRLETRQGSWFEPVGRAERFDIILSNPPYVRSEVIGTLAPEVRVYDPALALDGGADGLEAYRAIAAGAAAHLRPGGMVLLEIGYDQGRAVVEIMRAAGFVGVIAEKDLAGLDRVVIAHHL